MSAKTKVQIVHTDIEGDGETALYLDGLYVVHGDYYHNKISEYIDGILHGLKIAGKLLEETRVYKTKKTCDCYDFPMKFDKKWKEVL